MENEIFPMTVSLFLATIRRTPQVHNTTVPTMGEQNDVSSKREVGLETSPKAKRRLVFDDEKKTENEKVPLDHELFTKRLDETNQKIVTEKCERWGIDFLSGDWDEND
jgi:hypothetical protein